MYNQQVYQSNFITSRFDPVQRELGKEDILTKKEVHGKESAGETEGSCSACFRIKGKFLMISTQNSLKGSKHSDVTMLPILSNKE